MSNCVSETKKPVELNKSLSFVLTEQLEALRLSDTKAIYDDLLPFLHFQTGVASFVTEFYTTKGQATPSGRDVLQKYVDAVLESCWHPASFCDDKDHRECAVWTQCQFPTQDDYYAKRDKYNIKSDECYIFERRCRPQPKDLILTAAQITITGSYIEFLIYDLHDPCNSNGVPLKRPFTYRLVVRHSYYECYEGRSSYPINLDLWLRSESDRLFACNSWLYPSNEFYGYTTTYSSTMSPIAEQNRTAKEFYTERNTMNSMQPQQSRIMGSIISSNGGQFPFQLSSSLFVQNG